MTERQERPAGPADTAAQILDVAEAFVQVHGFNGFSYADVAARLQITKASIHYHFASKADLGQALIARYSIRFAAALVAIDAPDVAAPAKLMAYGRLYLEVLRNERMCLCGMLAAESATLPAQMQASIVDYFVDNESWLARTLAQGRDEGSLDFAGGPSEVARSIVSSLEGAMLMARLFDDVAGFEATARRVLDGVARASNRQDA